MNWNVSGDIYSSYIKICKSAAENESVFNTFKRNQSYTSILEHASKDMGYDYINHINSIDAKLLQYTKFFDNDTIGNPIVYDYEICKCSPTTLGYISVLASLINKLGSLENFNIVEIGGGYGGQAKIITDYFNVKSYSIIDLDEVTMLQDKYIQSASIPNTTTYTSNTYDATKTYDLVISCYALSEVIEPLQSKYVNDIVLNSSHGYMSLNGPITLFNEIESKFNSSIEKHRLPMHSRLGRIFNNNSCNLIW